MSNAKAVEDYERESNGNFITLIKLTDFTKIVSFLNSYIFPTFGFRLGRNFSPR